MCISWNFIVLVELFLMTCEELNILFKEISFDQQMVLWTHYLGRT